MRDLIIFAIVGVAAVMAFRRAWIGVMLWTWISIMNPHRFSWGAAYSAPIAMVASVATLIGLIFTRDRQSPFQGAPVWWLLALTIWITISWQMGLDVVGDTDLWVRVMKIFFMTFITLALLQTKHHIVAFVWVTVVSIALLATKGGIFTVATGGNYRVWGPPETFIEDNNHFALATVMVIPLLHFLQLQLKSKWKIYAITASMLLCAAAALGSQSRGGLLAISAMTVVFWLRSAHKLKIGGVVLVCVLVFLPMMPDAWWDRMNTIQTYEEDDSAMGRINAWNVAYRTAIAYPFGGGMSFQHEFLFERYGPYEATVRAAHSIYFEILGNHGFLGLFLFLMIFITAYYSASRLRRQAPEIPEAQWARDLGAMVQVSLVGYAVGGAFLSLPYFDLPYDLVVMVVLARAWVTKRRWETDPKIPFLEYAGLKRAPVRKPVAKDQDAAGGGTAPEPTVGRVTRTSTNP